ncbi:branched-chain amino acid ABC transporter permease [Nocardioides sp. L-11A]|uniref:branched-chain amino acid ABC transporter permease n=1 Tax=Nocardioides sp. L-11A TaxID=3043848 RepID=UPI00249BDF23|nr:branched-chain amino acid ABC transporter permease [Nocardioides sp. L-11A]
MSVSSLALAQTLLNGALLGCLFGSIALGLSVKWGHLGVADFFHLSLTLLGAYLTYSLVTELLWDPFLTLAVTVPAFFAVGVGVQWLFHLIDAQPFTTLLITFALFIVTESVVSMIWSPDLLNLRPLLSDGFTTSIRLPEPLPQLAVQPIDLVALVCAALMVGLAAYALRSTRAGRAVQAMRQDAAIAETLGVRVLPLTLAVSGLAAATAAVAGMVVSLRMPLTPTLPLQWIGIVVVATMLGGLGRPLGALVAAVVLMMIQNAWSLWFPPQWAPAVTFGVLFLFLALQPLTRVARERITSGRTA